LAGLEIIKSGETFNNFILFAIITESVTIHPINLKMGY
jgi:hypothetical protein